MKDKKGIKGSQNVYNCVEMAEYLLPYNKQLTVEEKREMFAVKNAMISIPANFSSTNETKCECGQKEEMQHIYECEMFNNGKQITIPFTKIFNGNLSEQILVYKKFSENMKNREKNKEQSNPCGQPDPLLLYSKG